MTIQYEEVTPRSFKLLYFAAMGNLTILPPEIWYSLPFPESEDETTQTVIWAEIESDAPRHPVLSFGTNKDLAKRFQAFADRRDDHACVRPEEVHVMILQTVMQEWRDKLQLVTLLATISAVRLPI